MSSGGLFGPELIKKMSLRRPVQSRYISVHEDAWLRVARMLKCGPLELFQVEERLGCEISGLNALMLLVRKGHAERVDDVEWQLTESGADMLSRLRPRDINHKR